MAEEEPHRRGHFITPCDVNSNQLVAEAARRCKRPRKRREKRETGKKMKRGGGVTKGERSVPETL